MIYKLFTWSIGPGEIKGGWDWSGSFWDETPRSKFDAPAEALKWQQYLEYTEGKATRILRIGK